MASLVHRPTGIRRPGCRCLPASAFEFYHQESASTGRHDAPARTALFAKESALMRKRWAALLDADPFYNPNLSL